MPDIAAQTVSWGGTPRAASPQYIQSAINAGANGTTYRLLAGIHRGQHIVLKSNDRLILAAGAILSGAEDVGTSGWTNNGNGTWTKSIVTGQRTTTNIMGTASGYDNTRGEKIILDGDMMAYRTNSAQVDSWHAYANGSSIIIGRDPGSLSLIEVIRTLHIAGGIELGGETTEERNKIYGYVGYELGHGGGERGAVHISSQNASIHDVEIFAMAAAGLALSPGSVCRNITVRHNGQCGVGGDGALVYRVGGVQFLEGCHVYGNGLSGWNNGWEGGNSKWAWTENLTVRGTLWEATNDPRYNLYDNTPTAAMWFDICNDGYRVSSSVFKGNPGVDWRGGIFLEISYSGKIWNNIFYTSGKAASSSFWQGGCVSDHSGAFPGSTIDSTIDVHDNLFYKTAGGWQIVTSGAHEASSPGWYGKYRDQYQSVRRNTVYLKHDSPFLPETTGVRNDPSTTYYPRFNTFDDNIYLVPSAQNRFNDEDEGGGGSYRSWAQWQTAGNDIGPRSQHLVGSIYDPDPFNGGAM